MTNPYNAPSRGLRGASFFNLDEHGERLSMRASAGAILAPALETNAVGFRVTRVLEPSAAALVPSAPFPCVNLGHCIGKLRIL